MSHYPRRQWSLGLNLKKNFFFLNRAALNTSYLPFPSLSHLLDPQIHLLVPKTTNSSPCKLCPIQGFPLYSFKLHDLIEEHIHFLYPWITEVDYMLKKENNPNYLKVLSHTIKHVNSLTIWFLLRRKRMFWLLSYTHKRIYVSKNILFLENSMFLASGPTQQWIFSHSTT